MMRIGLDNKRAHCGWGVFPAGIKDMNGIFGFRRDKATRADDKEDILRFANIHGSVNECNTHN